MIGGAPSPSPEPHRNAPPAAAKAAGRVQHQSVSTHHHRSEERSFAKAASLDQKTPKIPKDEDFKNF